MHISRRGFIQQGSRTDGHVFIVNCNGNLLLGTRNRLGLIEIDEAERGFFNHIGGAKIKRTDMIGLIKNAVVNCLAFIALD